jgi:hypothetical protein
MQRRYELGAERITLLGTVHRNGSDAIGNGR